MTIDELRAEGVFSARVPSVEPLCIISYMEGDEPIASSVEEWLDANSDMDDSEVIEIMRELETTGTYHGGGGAAGEYLLSLEPMYV